jgi:hypothetical protein
MVDDAHVKVLKKRRYFEQIDICPAQLYTHNAAGKAAGIVAALMSHWFRLLRSDLLSGRTM